MSVKRFDISGEHYEVFGDNNGEYCLYEDYAALEARCAALAAENAGLKESRKNLAEFIHEELDAGYPLNMSIETPSTDAFLAEVRAQGVEMFANHIFKVTGKLDLDDQKGADFCRDEAEDFAIELRKGVQS